MLIEYVFLTMENLESLANGDTVKMETNDGERLIIVECEMETGYDN